MSLTKGDIKVSKNKKMYCEATFMKENHSCELCITKNAIKGADFFLFICPFFCYKIWTKVQEKINIDFPCQKENREKFIIYFLVLF